MEKFECKDCGKEISRETHKDNNGLCYQCYNKTIKEDHDNNKKKETCPAVTIVRIIAIIEIIGAVIFLFMGKFSYIQNIIIGILLYASSEIIKLLFDIKILLKEKNKK